MTKSNAHKFKEILNCRFSDVTEDDVIQWSEHVLSRSSKHYVATVNVAILMMMRADPKLSHYINCASLTLADGQPIIWLSKLLKRHLPERVTGIDFMEKLAQLAAKKGKSIYIIGAKDVVLKAAIKKLKTNAPDLIIAGSSNGYFSQQEAPLRIKTINESKADILIVAMGVPLQEYFIQNHWDDLNVKLAVAVGGSLDVLSGQKSRAPLWMQVYGLEWLYRLSQEPQRLAKRYFITNSQFIYLSLKELFS